MWSWLIIILITLSCLFCFFSIVQLELKRPYAKMWIILTCFTIIAVVGTLLSVPSPILQKYSYEPKPAEIKLRELKDFEEPFLEVQTTEEQNSEQNDAQEETIAEDGTEDISLSAETPPEGSADKKLIVMVPELNVRSDADNNAEIIGNVQYGQIVTEVEVPEGSEWVKVRMDNGLDGWVSKRYLNYLTE
ncbi:SH3 domain-containing protein [Desulfotomaculum arcticum]|uniref:SH3 domain-containing protein n=1 Tax=Desulfotruncus arcticus DSM 17038 TaxID=1121424 RepID=A0A1I2VJV0_9FIRM|nr:SH3 domain-containing protein [Desulfotomaculum arcticum] [Desulfotruncus arcticus DSM 17038]